jgi:hypothetical protein
LRGGLQRGFSSSRLSANGSVRALSPSGTC